MKLNWPVIGAVGSWAYTILTGLILIALGYQISLVRQNNLVSERPFIYTDGWHAGFGRENGSGKWLVVINYRLINSGNTPTKKLEMFQGCRTSPTELTEPYGLLAKQPPKSGVSQIVGPRSSISMLCTFSEEDAKQMSDGKAFGYIVGKITYFDKLDPSKRHISEYAVAITHPVYVAAESEGNFGFSGALEPVGQHNCVDEDCPPDPTE